MPRRSAAPTAAAAALLLLLAGAAPEAAARSILSGRLFALAAPAAAVPSAQLAQAQPQPKAQPQAQAQPRAQPQAQAAARPGGALSARPALTPPVAQKRPYQIPHNGDARTDNYYW
jgi:hypothetical protein